LHIGIGVFVGMTLRRTAAWAEAIERELPATAAATTRVKAARRRASFINRLLRGGFNAVKFSTFLRNRLEDNLSPAFST
jgi:hypothetical protein